MYKLFAPLSTVIHMADWPSNLFQPEDGDNFLDRVFLVAYNVQPTFNTLIIQSRIVFKEELGFTIPGLDGTSLVFAGSKQPQVFTDTPENQEFPFESADDDPNEGFTYDTDLGPEWIELALSFQLDENGWHLTLHDATIELRISKNILKAVDGSEQASISVKGDIVLDSSFNLDFQGFDSADLSRCEIGQTGVIISANGVKLDLSRTSSQSEIIAAGFDESFIGIFIGKATVELPKDFPSLAPENLVLKNCVIGSGGVSGRLEANYYDDKTKTYSRPPSELFGIPFRLKNFTLEFKHNSLKESQITGQMLLPFFEDWVDIEAGINLDGSFSVMLDSSGSNGLYKLTKDDVLELELDSIGFEVDHGVFTAKLSGQITPLFGKDKGLNWPSFQVDELSIDSKGHVHLDGGWLNLREQYSLDFHGFHIGITKIGFGKTDDGGKWIGFSGELKLVDGFTAGASVEGLRVTWYDDGTKDTKITLNGVGVEFEIPEVVRFKGAVSYRELEVKTDGGATELVRRFDGDIKLELISLGLEIDAKLVVGSARGSKGTYTFFAIYVGVELPTGIPLGSTPLSLYGMAGLFALRMEPDKLESEEWFDGWYKRPDEGVTDLATKWVNRYGSVALGGGVTVGTQDNGFTVACKALLIIVFPGPLLLIEGKANLLKERTKLDEDPLFRSLTVIDNRKKPLEILMGLDARYKQDEEGGNVIDIQAGAEAYFSTPDNWHLYLGEREPLEKRIRAQIFKLFEANSYFMLDQNELATGVWVGYAKNWKFGPVGLRLEAWLEANARINWRPLHFYGELWMHGAVEVSVFGFELGLSVDARIEADVYDPFHVLASLEVTVDLPRPMKDKSFDLTLEWGPKPDWPAQLPLPLQEVAIEHFKVTTSWPLPKNQFLLPNYDPDGKGMRNYLNPPPPLNAPPDNLPIVPLDCRPHLSFGRAVHDDALVGVNSQSVQPAYERVGDPKTDHGPVLVRYGLKQLELAKWNEQLKQWVPVAAAGRDLKTGERKLYGSWAPLPQLPLGNGKMPIANNKLWLWSINPFDYVRHGGSELADWLAQHKDFSNYPCLPPSPADREVCFDFEKLDRFGTLISPWHQPEHHEIKLLWEGTQPRVTRLDPSVNGYTQALCFSSANPKITPRVTFQFSSRAKQVKIWLLKPKKVEKTCINFLNRSPKDVKLPLAEQGATIGVPGANSSFKTIQTVLGAMTGLNCAVMQPAIFPITLPCGATEVELMLTRMPIAGASADAPIVQVFDSKGTKIAEKKMLNPDRQPEIVRFEGSDLKQITIFSTRGLVYLHKLCFLCPASPATVTAVGIDVGEKTVTATNKDNLIELNGEGITQVQLTGTGEICCLKVCTTLRPPVEELAEYDKLKDHLLSTELTERWQQAGEVLEPYTTYRLQIDTTINAIGEGQLAGSAKNLNQTEYAYFRTEGPPGLTELSLPIGRDGKKFESGLDDLTRYVRQTIPATVPAMGEKPQMAKPFYRAYDIGIEFNENYVDLMYRLSERDLGLYLYDNNNRPVRDAEGRLLVQSGVWGKADHQTLTKEEARWIAQVNANKCGLPKIEVNKLPEAAQDKQLLSAVAGRVLEPDTIYEARLIPLLLRENFNRYTLPATAQGTGSRLGRWQVRDNGSVNTPSKWEIRQVGTPPSRFLTQTSNIKGSNDDAAELGKPGTMLILSDDPRLDAVHGEQPSNWTDYRLSVYLRSTTSGALGLVFRYRDDKNYYRFSLDRKRKHRRLISMADGKATLLKQDDFLYQPNRDYLITVEAIGGNLRIYQDGTLVFEANDAALPKGSIGLYCYENPGSRFSDVRVDDFRQPVVPALPQQEGERRKDDKAVYKFQFTTSLFSNFTHHLHSYQDETWHASIEAGPGILPTLDKAVSPTTPPSDDEARAYETLATAVLGQRARQNPREVQVTRVEIDGASLAFLLQSPEPLLDWSRIDVLCWRNSLTLPSSPLPKTLKLIEAKFVSNNTKLDSVTLLLREATNLTGYRVESRIVQWPIVPVVQTGPGSQNAVLSPIGASEWVTYSILGTNKIMPAGSSLRILSSGSGTQISKSGPSLLSVSSVEVRIVAPNGNVVHSKHFLSENNYSLSDMAVLRKADGTGFFLAKRQDKVGIGPLLPGDYRLKLTYHRDLSKVKSDSLIFSEAGDRSDEAVFLDIPWQSH